MPQTLLPLNYRIDLFAAFIFLGIVQGIFLIFFFLSKENRKNDVNFFQGIMILAIALNALEILLMYTGYIIHCLYLVDFSESIAFVIGPAFYLLLRSLIRGPVDRKQYLHFAFPVLYLLLHLPFLIQSDDFKYNSWVEAYHLNLPLREVAVNYDPRVFWITDHATEMILFSLIFYAALSLIEGIRAFRERKESVWNPQHPVLKKIRSGFLKLASVLVLIMIVKLLNPHDTGDHVFAAYASIILYMTSASVIRDSGFFRQVSLVDQKTKITLAAREQHQEILHRLQIYLDAEKPFLRPDFSLPDLAQHLKVTVHQLSQAINEGWGKSFFEMAAEYRVSEARKLLKDYPHIKVDEIAERVGYHSKSSFNTAFKKLTGVTPSVFRDQ